MVVPSFWVFAEVVFAVAAELFDGDCCDALVLDELRLSEEEVPLVMFETGFVLSSAGLVMVPTVVPTVPLKFA